MADEPNWTPLVASPAWRFTLKHLFIWTAIIALACVALRNANGLWVSVLLGVAFLIMAAAILLVIYRQGASRAYWIGFATFGWLYLLLVLFGWNIDQNSYADNPFRPHNLVTSRLSDAAYHWLYDDAFATYYQSLQPAGGGYSGFGSSGGMPMGPGGGYGPGGMSMMGSGMMPGGTSGPGMGGMGGPAAPPAPLPGPNAQDFTNVTQALWAILLAAIGGTLARWLYATRPAVGQVSNLPSSII